MLEAHPLVAFTCPHCKFDLRAAGSLAGRTTACPICERPLTVPLESDAGPPPTGKVIIDSTSVVRHPSPRPPS